MRKMLLDNPRADLYPVPVTLVSVDGLGASNIITVSWTGVLASHPPMLYISIRPVRKSYQMLLDSKKFCVNIPSANMVKEVRTCGFVSGNDIDKVSACGFDMISLVDGYPKAISQCKHLLCDVVDILELGSHTVFIAEVKFEFIDDNCIGINQSIDYESIMPIGYCRKVFYSIAESQKLN